PPIWARLPEDDVETFELVSPIPVVFRLGNDSRCRCGSPPNPSAPVKTIACILYDEKVALAARIEIQLCATCPIQSQYHDGPDLASLGIFNFNNTRLYTHNLLNELTSMMSSSETPFHAFRTEVSRDYLVAKSSIAFVSDDTFRIVYYAFSRVQKLGTGAVFLCRVCGPEPEVLLFDGVSAGYETKHCTDDLRPPTTTDADSPARQDV
ncbi:hypothetical protein AURDEDRAFT_20910, partial [Auricularia subglabra TFB-10046 SS5]